MMDTRPATREDLQAMADVINPIIAAGGTTAFEDPFCPEDIARMTLDHPGFVCAFVAVQNGTVTGFQYLNRKPDLPEDMGDIASFANAKGAGRVLMAATIIAARAAGLTGINAKIRADNTPGIGFYTKMGFQDHALARGVPLKDGTPVDRVIKRLQL